MSINETILKTYLLIALLLECLDEVGDTPFYEKRFKTKTLQYHEALERVIKTTDNILDTTEETSLAIQTAQDNLRNWFAKVNLDNLFTEIPELITEYQERVKSKVNLSPDGQKMRDIYALVTDLIPENWGAIVLTYPHCTMDAQASYISSSDRSNNILLLRDMANRLEQNKDFITPNDN